jgi:hypothetical protein
VKYLTYPMAITECSNKRLDPGRWGLTVQGMEELEGPGGNCNGYFDGRTREQSVPNENGRKVLQRIDVRYDLLISIYF